MEVITELLNEGKKRCPMFLPAVLPQSLNFLKPVDLFDAEVIFDDLPETFLSSARFSTTLSLSKKEIIIDKITVT
jgi:hypothetical protein